ncbi:hypothetical protein ILUMI_23474 [Ignelater luminosus]|uniref:Uncharacterized protein n=1 Tax=Ignelater luminosus TaxID=2038154 RepID=A0A8K0CC17_IGNLU|nr:hypothetical protein ILUMI_23474 [Ignelater luminosus]
MQAPDEQYLATKIEDLKDLNKAFFVTIPNTKTKIARRFTVTDNFYTICKKYLHLQPAEVSSQALFLNYQKGRCTTQWIGINKFGAMEKEVATYLKLANPELFTGHTFRSYIDERFSNKMATATKMIKHVNNSEAGPFISANVTSENPFVEDCCASIVEDSSTVKNNSGHIEDDEVKVIKGRKRKRNVEEGECNVRKTNLAAGRSDVTNNKKTVNERKLKDKCKQGCKLKCLTNLSDADRETILKQFWAASLESNQKRQFVALCITADPIKRRRERTGEKTRNPSFLMCNKKKPFTVIRMETGNFNKFQKFVQRGLMLHIY